MAGLIHEAGKPLLCVRNLEKAFGTKTVVDGISFDVRAGETFAFLGPNGAGKTTTIKMLTTLLKPDLGTVTIGGMDLCEHPMEARRQFGVVFQDCTLDTTMTVYENLWLHGVFYHIPRALRGECIDEALEMFDLQDQRRAIVNTLSGGQKRRAEIARALLHNPPLIFLDEPTLGLDPKSRRLLWSHLRQRQTEQALTVFLTTHYMDEVERFADHVAIIRQGRIIEQGSVRSVTQQTGHTTLEDAFLALTGRDKADLTSIPFGQDI